MKKLILFFASALLVTSASSQVTWSADVAAIMFEKCTSCHRPNGVGPFSLLTYEDASNNASDIDEVVLSGYMPPWHANNDYQSYSHTRSLSSEEIVALVEWVNSGTLEGNLDEAPPAPVYPVDGFLSAIPDLEVQIPEYTSQASNWSDDYVCFALPLGLTEDKKLRAYEVIPGNSQIVHHALCYIDPDGSYSTDLSGYCAGPTEGLIGGYTPGAIPTIFPSDGIDLNMGVTVPAGSSLIIAMHFPEGSAGETDDTKVRLYFYEDDIDIREISTDPIIQNWSFNLPPGQITPVNAQYNVGNTDISVLSAFPHMHLLGKDIRSYAIGPDNDTIPLIDIPHWDFEWQQFYFFENIQRLPAGSTFYGEGHFNTSSNPHNPNDPPISVGPGLNTSDEMFLIYFHYLAYQEGDELLDMEELTSLPTFVEEHNPSLSLDVNTYPNPFTESVTLSLAYEKSALASLYIYSGQGKLITKLAERQNIPAGTTQWTWTPEASIEAGIYYYSLIVDGEAQSGMIQLK
jgi:hypothetical protein